MLNLNSNLLNGNAPWDTNYARKYLQISEDQLEKINKIPGWSKTDISENIATENDKASQNFEKSLTPQASTSTGNVLISNKNISENIATENDKSLQNFEKSLTPQASTSTGKVLISNKNISEKDNLKNYHSDLQLKQDPVSVTEKESFLKNVSLSPLKKKRSPVCTLQRSSSLPDLYRNLISAEVLSHSKSQEILKNQTPSTEEDILNFKPTPLLRRNILNKTYAVSLGGLNRDKFADISKISSTCLLENRNQLSKQKLKALDDTIFGHKYLKETEISKIKSDSVTLASNQTVLKQEISLFEKKLLLLEKRLSPSKEMSAVPFNAKLINLENLNCGKNLKSSPSHAPSDEVIAAESSDSVKNLPDKLENSSSKSCNSLEPQANSQILNEKSCAHKNTSEFVKDKTGDASKAAVCNFDSFLSPPLPCGQPITAEVPSLSQIKSQTAELETPRKLKNAEFSNEIVAPKKTISKFNVPPANSNEIVSEITSVQVLGTKRKRKSRNEKSSRKLDVKKFKRTNIQFSSGQIKSMIEIMKIFHTEF